MLIPDVCCTGGISCEFCVALMMVCISCVALIVVGMAAVSVIPKSVNIHNVKHDLFVLIYCFTSTVNI